MRIKIPFIEVETDKNCSCSDYGEFEIKIKCIKAKLHCKYLLVIAVMICVWLFSVKTYNDSTFVSQMSFASTIASIILSVLAIIMSITGEGKTEHIKEQLEDAAKQIKESQNSVEDINESIEENLSQLNLEIKRLGDRIDDIPEMTAQKFRNENMRNTTSGKRYSTKLSSKEWENQKYE